MNCNLSESEIDKEYYEKALNRIEQYCRSGTLFKVADNGRAYEWWRINAPTFHKATKIEKKI